MSGCEFFVWSTPSGVSNERLEELREMGPGKCGDFGILT